MSPYQRQFRIGCDAFVTKMRIGGETKAILTSATPMEIFPKPKATGPRNPQPDLDTLTVHSLQTVP